MKLRFKIKKNLNEADITTKYIKSVFFTSKPFLSLATIDDYIYSNAIYTVNRNEMFKSPEGTASVNHDILIYLFNIAVFLDFFLK